MILGGGAFFYGRGTPVKVLEVYSAQSRSGPINPPEAGDCLHFCPSGQLVEMQRGTLILEGYLANRPPSPDYGGGGWLVSMMQTCENDADSPRGC